MTRHLTHVTNYTQAPGLSLVSVIQLGLLHSLALSRLNLLVCVVIFLICSSCSLSSGNLDCLVTVEE